ncbi:MAG: DMT family transporter [Woeseiaceae bacterium]|nr:DMT family transporter [Woeseiaceae bacterium]
MRLLVLTALAMLAFAGNSLLCRMALADGSIDPASFTVIRLVAAAVTLWSIVLLRGRAAAEPGTTGSWRSAVTLLVYAVCFSYAYVSLSAATGALVLFGTVQLTMIAAALLSGERPTGREVLGWLLAIAGFVALLLPGVTAPSLEGTLMMSVAGIGWGLYSLYGRGESRPLLSTTGNFLRSLLPLAAVGGVAMFEHDLSTRGIVVAALAGSLTTGLGYILWYAALPDLGSLRAALVQLSVPAIAAAGGILLLGEIPGVRVVVCGLLILGGIGYATARRRAPGAPAPPGKGPSS